jgi:DNA-binding winged helix-turn-helix (wHTH) protein/tetratricopeptide (TPR) repeat protein
MAPETPPDPSRCGPFTVGDWLAEPRACRLSRGDTDVKLRPQLVGLLVCLARRPGQIVLRDEILTEVWPGQFVAESGLSRCVAELRQSLHDDAQEPRFIETIPKRGYRLVAPVVWLNPAGPIDRRVTAPARAPSGSVVNPPVPSADAAPGLSATPGGTRAGWRAGLWITATTAVVTLTVGVALLLPRAPASALTDRDTVLLADVRNTTGNQIFDDALRLGLAVNLGQSPFLRILPDEQMRAAVVRTGRSPDARVTGPLALEVCRREGAAVLLAGSIAPLGSRFAVGLEAVACGSGDEIARALEEARGKEQVLTTLERVATRIRRTLGESRASLSQHSVPLARATTPSLEALRALTLGDNYRDHAKLPEAFAMYRHATELDPEFALAWARRGAAAVNLQFNAEVMPAFRRAYALRDRVTPPERFYIAAGYHRIVEADPEKAIEAYRAWKQMYPGSAIPPANLASALSGWMGAYEAAVPEAREAVRLAPYSSLASSNLITAYLGLGRTTDARAAVTEAVRRGQDDRIVHRFLAMLALVEGDRTALEREARWASGNPPVAHWILRLRASTAAASGRLREARRLWTDASEKARTGGSTDRLAEVSVDRAEAEVLLGDGGSARSEVAKALAAKPGAATALSAAIVLALAGDSTGSQTALDTYQVQPASDPVLQSVYLPVARALHAASRGRTADALGILQPVVPFERGSLFGLIPLGVHAILDRMAGHPGRAANAFEDLIGLRALVPESPWVPFARLSLARALKESGDTARSAAAYDAFLDAWKDADADAPLLIAARLERAAIVGR